jgi:hypothetical protein
MGQRQGVETACSDTFEPPPQAVVLLTEEIGPQVDPLEYGGQFGFQHARANFLQNSFALVPKKALYLPIKTIQAIRYLPK